MGRHVQLDLLRIDDLDGFFALLDDPRIYASGYVMHRRPISVQDSRALAEELFLAEQGGYDGRGAGRLAYAVRLTADGDLGPAGTLVGHRPCGRPT